MAPTAVQLLVLDPQIGKMHLVVEVREVVLERPLLDLAWVSVRMAVVVVVFTIAFMQPLLVLALQLLVQDDVVDLDVAHFQALGDAQIGLVDLHVVFELSLAFEAGVELLSGIAVTIAVMVEQVASTIGQDHGDVAAAVKSNRVHEALLAQMSQIAAARACRLPRVVSQVARRHDTKRTNSRERARLRAAHGVRAVARIVDDLSLASTRQVEVAHEHVAWSPIARIAAAIRPSLVIPITRVRPLIVARARSAAEIRWTIVFVAIAGISIATIVVVVRADHLPIADRTCHLARLKPSRYVLKSGDAGVTSIGVATRRSAHLSRKIIRISGVFDSSKGLLICGLWVRFPPGSPPNSLVSSSILRGLIGPTAKQESNRRARTGVFHLPSFIVGRSAPTRFWLEGYIDLGIAAWRRRSNGGSDAIGLLPDA